MMLVKRRYRSAEEFNTTMLNRNDTSQNPKTPGKNSLFNIMLIYFVRHVRKKLLCKSAFVPLITYTCHNLDQDPTRLKPCGIWGEDDMTWCMRRVVHVNKCCKHLNLILPHLDYITLAHNNHVSLFTIKFS